MALAEAHTLEDLVKSVAKLDTHTMSYIVAVYHTDRKQAYWAAYDVYNLERYTRKLEDDRKQWKLIK